MPRLLQTVRSFPHLTIAWVVAPLCAIGIAVSHCPSAPVARADGFAQAVAHLRSEAADDFVVVWPPDQADALSALPATLRAADAVVSEPAERRHHLRFAVIGPAGFDDPPELHQAERLPRRRFEDVEVARYSFAARDRVLFDLRRDIDDVAVSLHGANIDLQCNQARGAGGWACPGRPQWNHVGPESLRVEGSSWPCVWAHPIADHQLIIDLGRQPLGDVIELEAALSDGAASTRGGASVQITLDVEGVGGRTLRRTNAGGIAKLEMPTPGGEGSVRLTLHTGRDARRHLGINLRIIERAELEAPP